LKRQLEEEVTNTNTGRKEGSTLAASTTVTAPLLGNERASEEAFKDHDGSGERSVNKNSRGGRRRKDALSLSLSLSLSTLPPTQPSFLFISLEIAERRTREKWLDLEWSGGKENTRELRVRITEGGNIQARHSAGGGGCVKKPDLSFIHSIFAEMWR